MKNLVICLLTGLVLIGAQVIGGSSIVFASPCIRLDYGEMVGHTHVFWCVDKGSIAQKGSIEHPVWNVTVEKMMKMLVGEHVYTTSHKKWYLEIPL